VFFSSVLEEIRNNQTFAKKSKKRGVQNMSRGGRRPGAGRSKKFDRCTCGAYTVSAAIARYHRCGYPLSLATSADANPAASAPVDGLRACYCGAMRDAFPELPEERIRGLSGITDKKLEEWLVGYGFERCTDLIEWAVLEWNEQQLLYRSPGRPPAYEQLGRSVKIGFRKYPSLSHLFRYRFWYAKYVVEAENCRDEEHVVAETEAAEWSVQCEIDREYAVERGLAWLC
jgi:hypothetical protein